MVVVMVKGLSPTELDFMASRAAVMDDASNGMTVMVAVLYEIWWASTITCPFSGREM